MQITFCPDSMSGGIPKVISHTATMKNMDNFHYKGKPSRATAKSTPFAVSKDEWDTFRW